MKKYMEAGRLTSQRGIKGELRFDCWCDSPEFLTGIKVFYFTPDGGEPHEIELYRASIPSVVFKGCNDRETSAKYVGKTVYFDRDDITLAEGQYFNDDLIGLPVFDHITGEQLGTLTAVDTTGFRALYTVEGEHKYLIPAVSEFLKEIDLEKGIRMKIIEGLETDR